MSHVHYSHFGLQTTVAMASSLTPPASAPLQFSFPFHSPHPFSSTSHRSTLFPVAKAQPGSESETSSDEEPSSSKKQPGKGGAGFGGGGLVVESKEKRRGNGKRGVIRRLPIERPSALSAAGGAGKEKEKTKGDDEEQGAIQNAFVLTWLGLGCIILAEGIALAASGFLPEEWDRLLVKYLYPSFTPTVALFVGGSVAYGVAKYLQDEKMKNGN